MSYGANRKRCKEGEQEKDRTDMEVSFKLSLTPS
jgi:hypothetical protein